MGLCVFSIVASIIYLVGKQLSYVGLVLVLIGNSYMIYNAFTIKKLIPALQVRQMVNSGTKSYRIIRM